MALVCVSAAIDPPLLHLDATTPVSSFTGHNHWGGTPPPQPWARGGNTYDWRATAPTLFVFLFTATCTMLHQDLIPGLALTQHSTLARNNTSLPSPSLLPHPHTHTFQHTIFCKTIDPRLCVRFFVKGARNMGPPTPTRLGKVYKRALVVPPSSPHQRVFVCGTYTGTAQVSVSLVSRVFVI